MRTGNAVYEAIVADYHGKPCRKCEDEEDGGGTLEVSVRVPWIVVTCDRCGIIAEFDGDDPDDEARVRY